MIREGLTGVKKIIRLAIALGLMVAAAPAFAGVQADRAIEGVERLKKEGRLPEGAVIKILAKEGNVGNIWGPEFQIKTLWEAKTGVRMEVRTRKNRPVYEDMVKDRDFDLTLSRQREYPDLFVNGLITDLTPYVKKYGLDLSGGGTGGYLAPRVQTEFDGKVVAIPSDGDVAILYLRRDLLEDKSRQAQFQARYGVKLAPPETWEEYQRLLEFFHDPGEEFYGSAEQRNPDNGWMFWMGRYASKSAPLRFLFDDEMRPLIDSPEGVSATESYVAAVKYSLPDITAPTSDYPYTVSSFRAGKAFSIIQTLALPKLVAGETSPVRDKFIAVPMPGTRVGGELVRRTSFIYGNNLVVSTGSANPELAFLFAMWFTDPDISLKAIQMTSGLMDPFRENHLEEKSVEAIYTREALAQLPRAVKVAVPEGTGLPGDHEYMRVLSENLWLAASGKIGSAEAMKRTAAEWERITEKMGREKQKNYWRSFKKLYPG